MSEHIRCIHAGPCGGCTQQEVAYAEQVAAKGERLRELFREIVPSSLLDELQVIPAPDAWRYRNKMEFTFRPVDGDPALVLGLHQLGAYDKMVDLEMCHICPEVFAAILDDVRSFARASGLPAYEATENHGFWRFLQIRASHHSGGVLVEVFTKSEEPELMRRLARQLAERHAEIRSVWWSVAPGKADAAIAETTHLLVGQPFLLERIGGVELEVGPRTFVQPNVPLATRMYEDLGEALEGGPEDVLWDLYCGSGSIGLSQAARVRQVFGIERNPENVAGARRAAKRNGIGNFEAVRANLEKAFQGRRWAPPEGVARPTLVVTDPPRAGLHRRVLRRVVKMGAHRWAYIACRPESLKRDLQELDAIRAPYNVDSILAYDLFPHTRHVETVVVLRRET